MFGQLEAVAASLHVFKKESVTKLRCFVGGVCSMEDCMTTLSPGFLEQQSRAFLLMHSKSIQTFSQDVMHTSKLHVEPTGLAPLNEVLTGRWRLAIRDC